MGRPKGSKNKQTKSSTKVSSAKPARSKLTTAKIKTPAVKTVSVIQFQGNEFTEAECLTKAKAGFKKAYKNVELTSINIYIKPEEHKIYYVANEDKVGSVEL